ncbi:unnamed protein product [Prorocentrum cordatum]|uniref:J domain-containing protein n=1 Tax=Prorocentrum cordatum TaxID=2364126 RepID=A0ABN9UVM4_9DINO|nr:unnamed protein product [Polarella glacialis]
MAAQARSDHYSTLGIPRRAGADEVTRAYRSLAKQYHPDKASHLDEAARRERERQMAAINVAYSVVISPRQRQEYDLGLPETPPGAARPGPAGAFARAASRAQAAPACHPPASGRSPVSAGGGLIAGGGPPRPRYQSAGKYTQSSRQARRMDPSQYTVHVDGRARQFGGAAGPGAGDPAPAPAPSAAGPATVDAGARAGEVRDPSYLQRRLDQAREWERLHCPEGPPAPQYEWKAASRDVLRAVRERRQNRDLLEEESAVAAAA